MIYVLNFFSLHVTKEHDHAHAFSLLLLQQRGCWLVCHQVVDNMWHTAQQGLLLACSTGGMSHAVHVVVVLQAAQTCSLY
jgi:hypothetical protein